MLNQFLINLDQAFQSSALLGLGVSFLSGLLASFSPCIYPLIPITLGVVGAASASSRLKGFLISFVFVCGIAFVYTFLGVVSSLFGVFLGRFFINPITFLLLALLFFLFSAYTYSQVVHYFSLTILKWTELFDEVPFDHKIVLILFISFAVRPLPSGGGLTAKEIKPCLPLSNIILAQ